MSLPTPRRLKKPANTGTVAQGHAPRQEKALAERVNGKTIPASGALDEKGDVRIAGFLRIEAKCTARKSFSITQDMLSKIENAAIGEGEIPMIVVDFLTDTGAVKNTVCVVPDYVLDLLRR
jgi:hypothetical protein